MTIILLALLGIFLASCWLRDSYGGGTGSFLWVLFRLLGCHLKLAAKILLGIVLACVAALLCLGSLKKLSSIVNASTQLIGGGPQSEEFFRFMNIVTFPLQMIVDGFAIVAQLLCALYLLGFTGAVSFVHDNIHAIGIAAIPVYAIWLVYTIRRVVRSEYNFDKSVWVSRYIAVSATYIVVASVAGWYLHTLYQLNS